MQRQMTTLAMGIAITAVATGGVLTTMAQPGGQAGANQHAGQGAPGQQDLGAMLINGLRATEGCLGVDAGDMMSGKNVIVAWFENKAAVKRWYYSRTHMGAMRMFVRGEAPVEHEPLAHVADEDTPIMVIASLTPATEEELAQIGMPISQISIELFAPLPGGAHINGRLSPDSFEVAHMEDLGAGEGAEVVAP